MAASDGYDVISPKEIDISAISEAISDGAVTLSAGGPTDIAGNIAKWMKVEVKDTVSTSQTYYIPMWKRT